MAFGYESSASRRARVALQLRDRHGKWIEMGGGIKWFHNGSWHHGTVDDFKGTTVGVKMADGSQQFVSHTLVEPIHAKASFSSGKPANSSVHTSSKQSLNGTNVINIKDNNPNQRLTTNVSELQVGDRVYAINQNNGSSFGNSSSNAFSVNGGTASRLETAGFDVQTQPDGHTPIYGTVKSIVNGKFVVVDTGNKTTQALGWSHFVVADDPEVEAALKESSDKLASAHTDAKAHLDALPTPTPAVAPAAPAQKYNDPNQQDAHWELKSLGFSDDEASKIVESKDPKEIDDLFTGSTRGAALKGDYDTSQYVDFPTAAQKAKWGSYIRATRALGKIKADLSTPQDGSSSTHTPGTLHVPDVTPELLAKKYDDLTPGEKMAWDKHHQILGKSTVPATPSSSTATDPNAPTAPAAGMVRSPLGDKVATPEDKKDPKRIASQVNSLDFMPAGEVLTTSHHSDQVRYTRNADGTWTRTLAGNVTDPAMTSHDVASKEYDDHLASIIHAPKGSPVPGVTKTDASTPAVPATLAPDSILNHAEDLPVGTWLRDGSKVSNAPGSTIFKQTDGKWYAPGQPPVETDPKTYAPNAYIDSMPLLDSKLFTDPSGVTLQKGDVVEAVGKQYVIVGPAVNGVYTARQTGIHTGRRGPVVGQLKESDISGVHQWSPMYNAPAISNNDTKVDSTPVPAEQKLVDAAKADGSLQKATSNDGTPAPTAGPATSPGSDGSGSGGNGQPDSGNDPLGANQDGANNGNVDPNNTAPVTPAAPVAPTVDDTTAPAVPATPVQDIPKDVKAFVSSMPTTGDLSSHYGQSINLDNGHKLVFKEGKDQAGKPVGSFELQRADGSRIMGYRAVTAAQADFGVKVADRSALDTKVADAITNGTPIPLTSVERAALPKGTVISTAQDFSAGNTYTKLMSNSAQWSYTAYGTTKRVTSSPATYGSVYIRNDISVPSAAHVATMTDDELRKAIDTNRAEGLQWKSIEGKLGDAQHNGKRLNQDDAGMLAHAGYETTKGTQVTKPLVAELWKRVKDANKKNDLTLPEKDWGDGTDPVTKKTGTMDQATWDKLRNTYVASDQTTLDNNQGLRSGNPSRGNKAWGTKMDKMVKEHTLQDDATFFRGVALTPDEASQIVPGSVLSDPGVMSTDESVASASSYLKARTEVIAGSVPVMLELRGENGTPVADVMYGEFVFPKGSSIFIATVKDDPQTGLRYAVGYVNPSPTKLAELNSAYSAANGGGSTNAPSVSTPAPAATPVSTPVAPSAPNAPSVSTSTPAVSGYTVGQRVTHGKHGVGTVQKLEANGQYARVNFDKYGDPKKTYGIALTKLAPHTAPAQATPAAPAVSTPAPVSVPNAPSTPGKITSSDELDKVPAFQIMTDGNNRQVYQDASGMLKDTATDKMVGVTYPYTVTGQTHTPSTPAPAPTPAPARTPSTFITDPSVAPAPSVSTLASSNTPIDISKWTKQANTQMGSNPGGIYVDDKGAKWYVKLSQSDDHARTEVLADELYAASGVESAGLKLADVGNGKLGTASPMIAGAKADLSSHLKDKAYVAKIQEGFAMDAWLANWDVTGTGYDNIVSDGNGNPVRVDPGGALHYRARGTAKGAAFGDKANEWDSLRNQPGTSTKAFFGSMSNQQLIDSSAKVASFDDKKIDTMVDSLNFKKATSDMLKQRLKARRDDIVKRADALKTPATTPTVTPAQVPSTILPTAVPAPAVAPVSNGPTVPTMLGMDNPKTAIEDLKRALADGNVTDGAHYPAGNGYTVAWKNAGGSIKTFEVFDPQGKVMATHFYAATSMDTIKKYLDDRINADIASKTATPSVSTPVTPAVSTPAVPNVPTPASVADHSTAIDDLAAAEKAGNFSPTIHYPAGNGYTVAFEPTQPSNGDRTYLLFNPNGMQVGGSRFLDTGPAYTPQTKNSLGNSIASNMANAAKAAAPAVALSTPPVSAPTVSPSAVGAWKVGDRVTHSKHGVGTVRKLENNGQYARVNFDQYNDAKKTHGIKLTKLGKAPATSTPTSTPSTTNIPDPGLIPVDATGKQYLVGHGGQNLYVGAAVTDPTYGSGVIISFEPNGKIARVRFAGQTTTTSGIRATRLSNDMTIHTSSSSPTNIPDITNSSSTAHVGKDLFLDPTLTAALGKGTRRSAVKGDGSLFKVYQAQGFDKALPAKVTDAEFATRKAAGWTTLYRGLSSNYGSSAKDVAKMVDEFYEGDHYAGFGIYGNGSYSTPDKSVASGYSGYKGHIMEMQLDPKAKSVDYKALKTMMRTALGPHTSANARAYSDPGVFAAAKGYDLITVPRSTNGQREPYYVILNRSVLSYKTKDNAY